MPSQNLTARLRSIPERTWIALGTGVFAIALGFGVWTKFGGNPAPNHASLTSSPPSEGAPTDSLGMETEAPDERAEESNELHEHGQNAELPDDQPPKSVDRPASKNEPKANPLQGSTTPPTKEETNLSPLSGAPKDDISSRSVPSTDTYPGESKFVGEHYPETRLKVLARSEISSWEYKKVRYAINEIFARRGANFKTDYIRREFEAKSWYKPILGREAQNMLSLLTPVERENVKVLGARRRELERMGAK